MSFAYFTPPKPRFLGHRGAGGHSPENTLPSFEKAAAQVSYLETDAWLTRDGVPVFLHDESLLRTCGVDRKISELSWEEVKSFDAGATFTPDQGKSYPFRGQGIQVPSVEEVLKRFPDKRFNIEIKDSHPEAVSRILHTLERSGASERVLLAAEKDEIIHRIRTEKPDVMPTSASYSEVYAFLMWFMQGAKPGLYKTEAQAFQIPHVWETHDLARPEMIALLHSLGVEVHYWTINEASLIKKLLHAGADGIVTDFPELAQEFSL